MKINYKVSLKTPAITGQSGVIGKDIDIVTKRDNDNLPYFTGSHIKGILKDRCEYMKEVYENFNIENYFGAKGKNITKLIFSNLDIDKVNDIKRSRSELKDNISYLIGNRHGIKVDKKTRTTIDGSLFDYEYVNPYIKFSGNIEILGDIPKKDLRYIVACLFNINRIGGQKSRGLGSVKIEVEGREIKELNTIVDSILKKGKSNKSKIMLSNKTKVYRYEYLLEENTILKSRELSNTIETLDYIHGGTLRGAIVQKLLEVLPQDINKVISSMKVSHGKIKGTSLTPASFFVGKYDFNGKKIYKNKILVEENEIYFVGDRLIPQSEKENYTKDKLGTIKLERYASRFINLENPSKKEILRKKTDIGLQIDKKTRTSEDGKLFNREILEAKGTVFEGEITLDTGIAEFIKKNSTLRIGKMKNKGFGKGFLTLNDHNSSNTDDIEYRRKKLNSAKKWKKDNDKEIITLDCLSDIVLPVNEITNIGEELGNILGVVNFIEDKSFINISKLGGFNLVNNMRKSDELVISKGSVLTYEYEGNTLDNLEKIEKNGIGLRKNEGFGKIIICSPVHLKEEF